MFRVICNCYLLQRGCLPPLIYTLTERDNVRFHRGAIIPWRKLCERRATLRASPRLVVLLYRVIDLIPRELPARRCILSLRDVSSNDRVSSSDVSCPFFRRVSRYRGIAMTSCKLSRGRIIWFVIWWRRESVRVDIEIVIISFIVVQFLFTKLRRNCSIFSVWILTRFKHLAIQFDWQWEILRKISFYC